MFFFYLLLLGIGLPLGWASQIPEVPQFNYSELKEYEDQGLRPDQMPLRIIDGCLFYLSEKKPESMTDARFFDTAPVEESEQFGKEGFKTILFRTDVTGVSFPSKFIRNFLFQQSVLNRLSIITEGEYEYYRASRDLPYVVVNCAESGLIESLLLAFKIDDFELLDLPLQLQIPAGSQNLPNDAKCILTESQDMPSFEDKTTIAFNNYDSDAYRINFPRFDQPFIITFSVRHSPAVLEKHILLGAGGEDRVVLHDANADPYSIVDNLTYLTVDCSAPGAKLNHVVIDNYSTNTIRISGIKFHFAKQCASAPAVGVGETVALMN